MVISGLLLSDTDTVQNDGTATVLLIRLLVCSPEFAIISPEEVLCVAHVHHIVLSTNFLKVQGDEAWLIHVHRLRRYDLHKTYNSLFSSVFIHCCTSKFIKASHPENHIRTLISNKNIL